MWAWVAAAVGPTVDRFAAADNAQLAVFNSWLAESGSSGLDCFAQRDWHHHANWCHPPPQQVAKLLRFHVQVCPTAALVLYAPTWPAAPWWPQVLNTATWVAQLPPGSSPLRAATPFAYVIAAFNIPTQPMNLPGAWRWLAPV